MASYVAAQRAGHTGRAGAGYEQEVGVARAGGKEDPEPADIVDGAEEGGYLPLLRTIGAGVDMADVHRAPQHPYPMSEGRPCGCHGGLGLLGRRDGEARAGGTCYLGAPAEAEGIGAIGYATAAEDAPSPIE